jgi:hypothetical protein
MLRRSLEFIMMQYTPFGLIFGAQDVAAAQEHRDSAPYAGAWSKFDALLIDPHLRADPTAACAYDAFRWRLLGDAEAGSRALEAVIGLIDPDQAPEEHPYTETLKRIFGLLHAYTCLHDHPDHTAINHADLRDALYERVGIIAQPVYDFGAHEAAWLLAVRMATGVVMGSRNILDEAVGELRRTIESIHPAGYLPSIIERESGNPNSLLHTLQAVHGLTLAAEVAAHAGIDLWGYELRSVSLMTAAFYPLYYYYYPEKWKWSEGITLDAAQQMFRQNAAFLEIINRRRPNVHAINLIVDELRPIIDPLGGGVVTLTHHPIPAPKRRGWFGR